MINGGYKKDAQLIVYAASSGIGKSLVKEGLFYEPGELVRSKHAAARALRAKHKRNKKK